MSSAKWWYLQLWSLTAAVWFIALWWLKRQQWHELIKTVRDHWDAVFVVGVFAMVGSTALLGLFWFLRFIFRLVP